MAGTTGSTSVLRSSSWRPLLRLAPNTLVVIFSIIASGLLAILIVETNGSIVAGVSMLGFLAVVAITFYRIDWGFFVFIFFVFLFDQYVAADISSFTSEAGYFYNLNAIAWLPKFDQGVLTPMELQLILIVFVWILTAAIKKNIQLSTIPLKFVTITFALAIFCWIAYGLSLGGDFVVTLWETRALFYLIIFFVFVPQLIHTREQLQTLVWVFIAGITTKAVQGAIRFAGNGFGFGQWPNIYSTFTNHEDPVFMITLFILLIGLSLFRTYPAQRKTLLWLLFPLLMGFVAAQRRATYASFMATLLAFIVLLPSVERKRMLKVLGIIAIVFGLYLLVFWDVNNRLGVVAQQFKATVSDQEGVRGKVDIESTMYRKNENYNLGYTFQTSPLLGIGFGTPYNQPLRMWGVQGLALGRYIAHNQILWICVQMGAIGVFLFWFFFNSYIFYATVIFRRLKDPYFKTVCAVCIVQVVNQFVVSYVDMQLIWTRNMTYLGTLMAIVTILDKLDKEEKSNNIG